MSFLRLLHSEWTKFRTVRGWLVAVVVAGVALIGIGLLSAAGSRVVAAGPNGGPRRILTGPAGEAVQDDFTFRHRTLTGDGTLTAQVTGFSGVGDDLTPWAKAGVLIKGGTRPGSTYAAVLLTGAHGVRMQHDFTGDRAGPSSGARWVRLVRSGQTITGYASADGAAWTRIAAVTLPQLPASAEAGVFVTSPEAQTYEEHVGRGEGSSSSTTATATFTGVTLSGAAGAAWRSDVVGADLATSRLPPGAPAGDNPAADGGSADQFTLSGSGDVAPNLPDSPGALERTLVGTFAGLTVLVVLAVLMMTSEYRRGMIRTTFAASPHRVRVLAAKSLITGTVAFAGTLIAGAVAVPWARHFLIGNNVFMVRVSTATEIRMLLGTALLVAVAAVFALAMGALLRHGAGAVTIAVVLIVLPYLLATAGVLTSGPANWLLRLTPAAAFAIQQTIPLYHQIDGPHTPALGYFPLSPWSGLAVLGVWTAAAVALAAWSLRRRDA